MRKSKRENEDKQEREIIIKVIDTPRGPVPHADTLKNLVEAWNEILIEINSNLKEVFSTILELKEGIQGVIAHLENLTSVLNELSIKMTKLTNRIDALMDKLEQGKLDGSIKEKAKKDLEEFL